MVLYDILGFSLHAWTLINTERGRSLSGITIRSVPFSNRTDTKDETIICNLSLLQPTNDS